MLTQEYLKAVLSYDEATGVFLWKVRDGADFAIRRWNKRYSGKRAGLVVRNCSYRRINIHRIPYAEHRLAWLYVMGRWWPSGEVDHINMDKSDNRWANLRNATRTFNNANKGVQSNNTSGFKGVYWSTQKKKWGAKVVRDRHQYHVGFYAYKEDAAEAYFEAAKIHFGEFARMA